MKLFISYKHLIFRLIALLVIPAMLLSACDSGPQAPAATPNFTGSIRIGVAAPYTGDTADGGIQIMQGAQLAADETNAQGGVDGKKIEIVAADDQAASAKAQDVAKKLVDAGVVAVVGHKDSGVSIPASAIYHAAGIVQITPTSSNPALTTQGFDTVFRVCPNDGIQGPFLAEFLIQKLGKKKIAVIHANTAYGQGLDLAFETRAKELGVTPLTVQEIKRGDKDFTDALQAIQPLAPEAIFYAGSLPEGIIVASQMKELGITATFLGGDTLFQADFPRQVGSASEGAYVSSFFPDVAKSQAKEDTTWVAAYRNEFKRNPGGNSSGGYVAAQALIRAIKDANSTDPLKIKDALKKLDMQSLIGHITFDQKGDLQDQSSHLHIFQVKDGEFIPVQP